MTTCLCSFQPRERQIDYRFGAADDDLFRKYAAELIALAPDNRLNWFSAQRYSIATLRPSTKPASPSPWRNARTRAATVSGDPLWRNPTTGVAACCARATLPAAKPPHHRPRSVRDGGLLSYGPDYVDIYRRAATYVDRILRGEKGAGRRHRMTRRWD